MSLFRHSLREVDFKVLGLVLEGKTDKEVLDIIYPDRDGENDRKNDLLKIKERLTRTLALPYRKRLILANKEQVLKNLEAYKQHAKRYDEFLEKERELVRQSEYKDLSDLY